VLQIIITSIIKLDIECEEKNKESPTKGLGRKTITLHLLTMDEKEEPPMKKKVLPERNWFLVLLRRQDCATKERGK
jgi:hypothetical protein